MKKILVLAAALVLVLCAAAACAEERYYVEVGALDADGNVTAIADLTDPLVLYFDDATMTCAYGTKDTNVEGTCEVTGQTDTAMTIVATFPNETVTFTYAVEQDMFLLTDEASGTTLAFTEAEETMEAVGDGEELHDRIRKRKNPESDEP